jgi:perosamine synthetase
MGDFIPVNEPLLTGNEKKYLIECIDTGWISSEGPFVKKFEAELAHLVGRKHAIAVSNGTVALEVAVAALGLHPGDEIIMPTFTIISCAAAVLRCGCIPVLVDCDAATWNMDVNQIEDKITSRTRAIMVVHIYGLPVDMAPIEALAAKHDLRIIEDAAEMHGQTYAGKPCGSFGDLSTFSFYPNKHITTGEGGMVFTDSDDLAASCRSLMNLCFKPEKRFLHEELGYNFRMTNLQAAVGLAQAERLAEFVVLKRSMGQKYNELLSGIANLQLPLPRAEYAENIYWVYAMVLSDEIPFDAAEAMSRLGKLGVGSRPFFWCMHEQPALQKMGLFRGESYPVSEKIARRGFYIPSGLALTEAQMVDVANKLKQVVRGDD